MALPIQDLTREVEELRQNLRDRLATLEDNNVHQDQVLDTIVNNTAAFKQV